MIQEEIPVYPLVQRYANVFAFDDDFMSQLKQLHSSCGYASYLAKVSFQAGRELLKP